MIIITGIEVEEPRSSNEFVVAVSSTVVVFLVISILTLIAGFVCGYYVYQGSKMQRMYSKDTK